MSVDRRPHPSDPTAERTADQSTQQSGGLHRGLEGARPGPGPEVGHDDAEDLLGRNDEDLYATPRRYEQEDTDSTMPSNDSSLNTKI